MEILNRGDKKYSERKFYEALECYLKALNNCDYITDSNLHTNIREKIARSYYRQGNFSEAIRHFEILEACTSGDQLIKIITLKSVCFNLIGKFTDALKSLNKLDSINSPLAVRKRLFTQGTIFLRLGQYVTPDYLEKAENSFLEVANLTDDSQVLQKTYRNLGTCYNFLGKFCKSLKYLNQALKLTDNEHTISYTYHELANTYIKLGDLKKALDLLQYCEKIASSNDDHFGLAYTFMNYGEYHFAQKCLSEGESSTNIAIDNFLKSLSFPEISYCYKLLNQYFHAHDSSKAQVYFREYNRFKSKLVV